MKILSLDFTRSC